jgi:hypothetical protein
VKRTLIVSAFVVVILALGSTSASAYTYTKSHQAWDMCSEFVRDRLKAPKTADFAEYGNRGTSVAKSGTTYSVNGYVDSENSFGADIRTQYTCTVTPVGGKRWRLVDLQSSP